MREVLYRSLPVHADFDESDLAILRVSLRNNIRDGITGYLIRASGQFFQALQGPDAAIAALMARIAADPRHHGLEVLIDRASDAPSPFGEWSMGYDHFLPLEAGLDFEPDGRRPALDADQAQFAWERIVAAAQSQGEFGSVFPHARLPGEAAESYVARIAVAL